MISLQSAKIGTLVDSEVVLIMQKQQSLWTEKILELAPNKPSELSALIDSNFYID